MTGLTPFSIEKSDNFQRSFKKLAKAYRSDFIECVAQILENLIERDENKQNLYGSNSEPGLEASYADIYIDANIKSDSYHILNEELW